MSVLVERGHIERPQPGAPGRSPGRAQGTIEEHLDNSGFTEYVVDTVDFANVYPSVDEWIASGADCSMMMRTTLERLDPAEREDAIEAIRGARLALRAGGRLGRRAPPTPRAAGSLRQPLRLALRR